MTPTEFQTLTGAWPERMADLAVFLERLTEANEVMNLVGPDSIPDFWNRHAWDSAQLLDLAPEAKTWADLGAGAGFPGLVLAILLKGRPGAHVWLIDSLQRP
jgi:16S rRNA (guanine527-N7)-methyltransferase